MRILVKINRQYLIQRRHQQIAKSDFSCWRDKLHEGFMVTQRRERKEAMNCLLFNILTLLLRICSENIRN